MNKLVVLKERRKWTKWRDFLRADEEVTWLCNDNLWTRELTTSCGTHRRNFTSNFLAPHLVAHIDAISTVSPSGEGEVSGTFGNTMGRGLPTHESEGGIVSRRGRPPHAWGRGGCARALSKIGYEITNLRNVVLIRDSNSGKSLKKMKEQTWCTNVNVVSTSRWNSKIAKYARRAHQALDE